MDTVFVENLTVSGIHGVTAKEKDRTQTFRIDIAVDVENALPNNRDDVLDVIDYRTMKKAVEHVVTQERHELVETIALRIIEIVFPNLCIKNITVSVRKVEIWNNGIPGVTVRRSR